jgi:hypothetical protein
MQKIFIFSIVVILVSIFSCQEPLQEVTALTNGTAVTSEEKAKLDALKPEVDRILTEVLGDSVEQNGARKIKSQEQVDQIKELVTNLLRVNFGDEYKKFITEKELTPGSISKAPNLSAGQVLISNPIQKNIYGYLSTQIGEKGSFPAYPTPYVKFTVNTTVTPWYSYNYATQDIYNVVTRYRGTGWPGDKPVIYTYYESVAYPVYYQSISIVDQGIQLNLNTYNSSNCGVIGILVTGGAATASSVTTYHYIQDPKVYNGSVGYGWNWWM